MRSGMRMASVQTAERRLRFSMVVRLYVASWRELSVMPKVKNPKRPALLLVSWCFGEADLQTTLTVP